MTRAAYNPDAVGTTWATFLEEILPSKGIRDYLRRVIGVALLGKVVEHNLVILGARWRHPAATAAWSATIRTGCLFVYSTNTPFGVTEAGNAAGYTRFRAYTALNFDGDMSAAARAIIRNCRETA